MPTDGSQNCRILIMRSNYAHFLLILETEPAVEFKSVEVQSSWGSSS